VYGFRKFPFFYHFVLRKTCYHNFQEKCRLSKKNLFSKEVGVAPPHLNPKHYPYVAKWLIQQVFGGTGFQPVRGIFAQPGKAVPPGRKTYG
jgi:hypothetical protein